MASSVEHKRTRSASCFSRAARRIRKTLSRICSNNSSSSHSSLTDNLHFVNSRSRSIIPRSHREDSEIYPYVGMCAPLQTTFQVRRGYVLRSAISKYNPERNELANTYLRANRTPSPSIGSESWVHRNNSPSFLLQAYHSQFDTFADDYNASRPVWRGRFLSCSPDSLSLGVSASGDESDTQVEIEASLVAVNYSVPNTQPTCCPLQMSSDPGWSRRGSSCLLRSLSVPSLSQVTSAKNKTFTRAKSLPDLLLENSFEEFTPDITVDENDEAYWLRCSCPGLYQCRVTGLVFHMKGEGDVVYRIVPWNRRLLAQHHKQPAGPLFDIKCLQQSVCQLHLPHCEICSTGGCDFLSVAHVNDEGIEFITPHKITESHVVVNITGFSAFGNVKDEDSPPDPVRALVLLFYRPPADPDPTSLLNVLLLPRNVVLQDVLRTRKKLVGDESYIETSSHCKLHPKQEYTLSTCPEDDSFRVQPEKAEFDCDNYDNYIPSFQVRFKTIILNINLLLRDTSCSHTVWESEVYLSSNGVKRSCGPSILNLPSRQKLFDIRSSFIDGISGPVLKSLLDKLFDKKVMTDSERESADEMQNKRDKARFVIDTVRMKGEAASSEMIEFLCETDPFLCEHLGLV
uniref:NACHT, LRR and PYD domains-containing protein 1b allele 2-like n=1 Tax=Scatophagus argus TaxID=75038 RepID=UPI001ED7E0EE|nr:NACHT, LRR and PYD domains-containing protein 1b allele 2-like [Scatophagus argus]